MRKWFDKDAPTVVYAGSVMEADTAKSLLECAGIFVREQNDISATLFGAGEMGTGYNVATGPVEVLVRARDVRAARRALKDLIPPPVGWLTPKRRWAILATTVGPAALLWLIYLILGLYRFFMTK